jgi:DNA-binding FrmR family transcriptional regulator
VLSLTLGLFRSEHSYLLQNPRIKALLYSGIVSLNREGAKRMAHTTKDKEKLLNRVRRIKGQIEAIEKALDEDQECSKVLQTIAASRGAINGLMAELVEGHVRYHVLDPHGKPTAEQADAADELIDIVNRYLK